MSVDGRCGYNLVTQVIAVIILAGLHAGTGCGTWSHPGPSLPSPPPLTGYPYTPHLLALDSCRPERHGPRPPVTVQHAVAHVTTPLHRLAWRAALAGYPDPQFVAYILDSIEDGFRIGFERPRPLRSASSNCPSAEAHSQVVVTYIEKEVALGRFLGPLSRRDAPPQIHVSQFEVILKGHIPGKWRLITDLSFPGGLSVNDGIAPTPMLSAVRQRLRNSDGCCKAGARGAHREARRRVGI